jgi:serine/threonine-protein kinase SRPK3
VTVPLQQHPERDPAVAPAAKRAKQQQHETSDAATMPPRPRNKGGPPRPFAAGGSKSAAAPAAPSRVLNDEDDGAYADDHDEALWEQQKQQQQQRNSDADARGDNARTDEGDDEDEEDDEEEEDEGVEGYRRGGYHPVRVGERYKQGRYTVLRKLGWGHFSTVWLVLDRDEAARQRSLAERAALAAERAAAADAALAEVQSKQQQQQDEQHQQLLEEARSRSEQAREAARAAAQARDQGCDARRCFCALKVQKSAPHYTEAARDEVELLRQVARGDPDDSRGCCRLLDTFDHVGPHGRHVCLVFEVLGDNLLALVRKTHYRGVPLPVVKSLARQVLVALDYLHRERGIIHTDLKPENVMLVDTLAPRRWRAGEEAVEGVGAGAGAAAAAAAGGQQQPLSKSQKKKAKRKAKAAAAAGGGAPAPSGSTMNEDDDDDDDDDDEEEGEGNSAAAAVAAPPATAALSPARAQQVAVAAARAAATATTPSAAASAPLPPVPLEYESRVLRVGSCGGGGGSSGGGGRDEGEGASSSPSSSPADCGDLLTARAKVVDFGNACWVDRRFTDDVQTRQYRSPEVLLGAKWGPAIDVWSLACLLFELATGDFLFDPRAGKEWDRDEDHLALMIELLGKMPKRVWSSGSRSRDYFTRAGELRSIKKLKPWPLAEVLHEKYRVPKTEAEAFAGFLLPMLSFVPEERATAQQMLSHPWLDGVAEVGSGGDGGGVVVAREEVEEEEEAVAGAREVEREAEGEHHARSARPQPASSRSPSPSPPAGARTSLEDGAQQQKQKPQHASAR